jgi:serine/threonine protein kinase
MAGEASARYRLSRRLAGGNMGEVFLAEYVGDAGFRRCVVVKRLYRHLAHHAEAVRMFQDEAHVLASLNHPNIPQVYDLYHADGYWFLAIEFVPGHTLAELLTAASRVGMPIPFDAVVSVIEQLCDALHHAHERNDDTGRPLRVVHRDVTPHNLMITPDGFSKLLDFGVARTAREESQGGSPKGTLAYMSPEQVRGHRLDKRSDVFSVGVILYELTTGRRLFSGPEVEVMTAIVERDVVSPSVLVPGFPAELEHIVLTALARDRGRRYPSAQHMARALEELAVSWGVIATHQSLARLYQQVFSAAERRDRTTGTYGHVAGAGSSSRPPPPSGMSDLDALASLRVTPPPEPSSAVEPPPALRLPGTPVVVGEDVYALDRPKRR